MIVCIPSRGSTVDSKMDDRFGRAAYFALYNSENDTVNVIENIHAGGPGGAGTRVVQFLLQKGVNLLIAPRIGGNAEEALKAGNVQVIFQNPDITVQETYDSWKTRQ